MASTTFLIKSPSPICVVSFSHTGRRGGQNATVVVPGRHAADVLLVLIGRDLNRLAGRRRGHPDRLVGLSIPVIDPPVLGAVILTVGPNSLAALVPLVEP